jgi:predicted aspartyl protease
VKIRIEKGLPYVTVALSYRGQQTTLDRVILDTGSAASLFAVDEVSKLGLIPEPMDPLRRVLGVGGSEYVFSKRLDRLVVGTIAVKDFPVQIGAMDYGFPLHGLIGMDFLLRSRAVIDLGKLEVAGGV